MPKRADKRKTHFHLYGYNLVNVNNAISGSMHPDPFIETIEKVGYYATGIVHNYFSPSHSFEQLKIVMLQFQKYT